MSTYLGQHRAPRATRRTPLWRSAIAGLLGLTVVGAASASTCAGQAVALPRAAAVAQTAPLGPSPDGDRSTEPGGSESSSSYGSATPGRAPAASDAAARARALNRTPARAQAARRAAADRAPAAASRSRARAGASKPARAATATKPQALGPMATLARTPAARSTRTSRVAALAFPDLTQFTWVGPVSGTRQTSGFGPRWGRLHAGLDFAGPVGTPLRALSSGVVVHAAPQGGYGNKVSLLMWDGSLVNYGHMDSIAVKRGQRVSPGQIVGRLGNTGHSTGPHLHVEVRPDREKPVDPWPWFVARGILPKDTPRK